MASRPPRAKIVKAHKALDQALADWQASIRPYYEDADPGSWIETFTDRLTWLVNEARDMRREVERNTSP